MRNSAQKTNDSKLLLNKDIENSFIRPIGMSKSKRTSVKFPNKLSSVETFKDVLLEVEEEPELTSVDMKNLKNKEGL
jgi:hypothetical protein